jgi:hypothetical protein
MDRERAAEEAGRDDGVQALLAIGSQALLDLIQVRVDAAHW